MIFFFAINHPDVLCKKDVLKILAKFTEKHMCWRLFFDKIVGH